VSADGSVRPGGLAGRVVIVGGGIGGLATAALLARGGALVTLLERHDTVGGRTGTVSFDGFRFDTGPSWYFMPEVFEHLFALLGERVEDHLDLVRLDPAYRVFPEPVAGRPAQTLDVVADAETNWRTFDALEPGAGDAVRAYVAASGEAYRTALDHFLYTTFARLDRVLSADVVRRSGTLVGLLTQTLAAHVENTVKHPVLRQVLGYHAVFLGSSPYRVPALYSLIEALERIARANGVEIRTGADVVAIEVERTPRSWRHPRRTGVARGVRLASGEVVEADVVVSAADRHHTETALLGAEHRSLSASWWKDRGPGISSLLIMAGVRGELPELPHHSLFFTRDWAGNLEDVLGPGGPESPGSDPDDLRVPDAGSLYVSRTSATEPGTAPPGHENLFVLVPFPADARLGADETGAYSRAALEAHADRYLDQIGRWAGIPHLRDRVVTRRVVGPADFARDFSAWRGSALGMEHTLRQSAMFRPSDASARVPNLLHVGGGTIPGVGLPMCAISAELVVKRMLGETSAHPLPTPLRPGFLASARADGVWGRVVGRRT
jgi:phytoene desaturase